MYSDGIIEAMNDEGNTFGKENLKNALENCSNLDLSATFKKVLSGVREWCKPRRPTDDLTILGISLNQ
jgi:serine phosphatase RsbU (regulator of sigma subunit)